MKRLVLTMLLIVPNLVLAGSSSQVAWTPKTLNFVKNGNSTKGKELAQACIICHGEKGQGIKAEQKDDETIPAIPALAGQVANYTYKQLRDYANDDRSHDAMASIAKGLSEQDAADLAVWFNSIALPENKSSQQNFARAEILVQEGDGKRILPQCFVCHGANGQGEKMDIPALAGQQADYFARTLIAYKNGERHNDIYSRMRLIAKQLTDEEIKELADYYQHLK